MLATNRFDYRASIDLGISQRAKIGLDLTFDDLHLNNAYFEVNPIIGKLLVSTGYYAGEKQLQTRLSTGEGFDVIVFQ